VRSRSWAEIEGFGRHHGRELQTRAKDYLARIEAEPRCTAARKSASTRRCASAGRDVEDARRLRRERIIDGRDLAAAPHDLTAGRAQGRRGHPSFGRASKAFPIEREEPRR